MRSSVALPRLLAWAGVWAVIVVTIGVLRLLGVEVLDLFRDVIELDRHDRSIPWKGSVGVLGAVAWFVAATCVVVAASVLPRGDGGRTYLAATGVVLAALGLDDALGVHDHLLPYLTGKARTEDAFLVLLAGLVVVWAIRFRERLLSSDVLLLGMTAIGLGTAFGVDAIRSLGADFAGMGLVEEVAELLGVVTLVAWAFAEARRAIATATPATRDASPAPRG